MFFREKTSIETHNWIVENFEWAIAEGLLTKTTPLVSPTPEFFKTPNGRDHETVLGLVDDLKRILCIPNDRIEVVELNVLPDQYRHEYGVTSTAAGTWQGDTEQSVISYDPNLFDIPLTLLSTLAHELMHHILHHRADEMPGGEEAEELNTDLHVISMGLGIIEMLGAEAAGWQGYMRQPTRAYALAAFLAVRDLPLEAGLKELPGRSKKYVRDAAKDLAGREDDIAKLQQALATA